MPRPRRRPKSQKASHSWAGVAEAVTEYSTRDSISVLTHFMSRNAGGIRFPKRLGNCRRIAARFQARNSGSQHGGNRALQFEQTPLPVEAAAVATKGAVGSNHPVAGHDDRDRIAMVGHAHGAEGMRPGDGAGNICVGAGRTVGNSEQGAPASELKRRAAKVEGEGEFTALAGKIFGELGGVVGGLGFGVLPGNVLVLAQGVVTAEFENDETLVRDGEIQGAEGRIDLRVVEGFHERSGGDRFSFITGKSKRGVGGEDEGRPEGESPSLARRAFWGRRREQSPIVVEKLFRWGLLLSLGSGSRRAGRQLIQVVLQEADFHAAARGAFGLSIAGGGLRGGVAHAHQ